jgi:hypothetical protein
VFNVRESVHKARKELRQEITVEKIIFELNIKLDRGSARRKG